MDHDSELLETVIGLPPEGWSLGHATIRLRGDKRVPIEAMRRGAFAVHEVELSTSRAWRLSHAPTGFQIWTFDNLEQAIELAERIEPFAVWEAITNKVPGAGLYSRVRAVIDQIESKANVSG